MGRVRAQLGTRTGGATAARAALYDSWHVLDWPPLSRDREVQVFHAPSLAVPPKAGKRLVVSVHDAAPWLFPETFPFGAAGSTMPVCARRPGVRTSSSPAPTRRRTSSWLTPGSRPNACRVIPYGVDHPYVEPDPEDVWAALQRHNLVDRQFVLWVGSLEPRKGLGTLVAAAATLARRGAAPTLVLAGYAGWRNSKVISPDDRAVLGPALRELGRLPQPELNALYASATLFAFPSLHEGFGLPVLEAMAAGAPVVASDIPAVREVAGDAAVLVPPADTGAWAEALSRVLESPSVQADLAGAGRRRAALFSWSKTAEATLGVYEELVR